MENREEEIEELLWDLDEFYPESNFLEEAWATFDQTGDLSDKTIKKLKRMLNRAVSSGTAA